mgnify:CR=1 FL=1
MDGIIRQDALGLSNIYFQAKRYTSGSVGSGDIRDFMGAMDTRGASQGVFITASTFAPAAVETARNYCPGKIMLIDGLELTSLMLRYGGGGHRAVGTCQLPYEDADRVLAEMLDFMNGKEGKQSPA